MSIVFYTIGDWGKMSNNLLNVAESMDTLSSIKEYRPNFILSLGDNMTGGFINIGDSSIVQTEMIEFLMERIARGF